ncbi:MAG: hypothetical protein M0R80_07740 [Proteobacteria bacterium]|jgi:hypothetical protein|nr:hypothetical protein [Pseudomonadota bacterium]
MVTDYSKPIKINIKKLQQEWSPFRDCIWVNVDRPITREEIANAIKKKQFITPETPKPKDSIWDVSSREQHLQRIAWFVCNFSDNYPIEIDFGIPGYGNLRVDDGNHRFAAAIYLKKKYISAICGGAISEIERYHETPSNLEKENSKAIA